MPTYAVDPADPTRPLDSQVARQGGEELRALKGLVQTLIGGSPAAPINVFRRNAIIGGDFDLNPFQRGINFVAAPSGTFIADRFKYFIVSGTGVLTLGKVADSPILNTAYKNKVMDNFSQNCLQGNVTVADVAMGAGEFAEIRHSIEGYFWKSLAQVPIVLSFWHKHTKVGTYCVGLRNSADDRSYVAEYTQAVADTWEFERLIITASPAAGTWNYTNGIGLKVSFIMACSATFQTPPNIWTVGNFFASVNQVNSLDTIGNKFTIAQVQLEAGLGASKFEDRDFEMELALCQRYYEKSFALLTAPAQNVGINTGSSDFVAARAGALVNYGSIEYAVRKRVPPNPTFYNPAALNAQARDLISGTDCSVTATQTISEHGFTVTTTGNAATGAGNLLSVHWTADAEL